VTIDEKDVTTEEQLGTGGFSVVYRGTWLGTPVAVKKWLSNGASDSERSEMRGEIMSNVVRSILLENLRPSLQHSCLACDSCGSAGTQTSQHSDILWGMH
jgi:hypothetical protein